MNRVRLVILDIDGTLVDSQTLIVAAQRDAFAAVGLPAPTRERSLSIVGLSLAEAFTALVGRDGPVAELSQAYRDAFGRLRAEPSMAEPLFAGAAEFVGALAARSDVLLGIATGKSRRGVNYLIERHGWHGAFATIQTADDAPSKPDPTMLRQALAEAGVPAAQAVMVGDTSFDMLMARGAGMLPVGVSWGYHPVAALNEAGAATIIDRFDELNALVGSTEPGPFADA